MSEEKENPYKNVISMMNKGDELDAKRGRVQGFSALVVVPKARYRYVVLHVIAGPFGDGKMFPSPEELTITSGGIFIPVNSPGTKAPVWCSNIYEIVALGEGVNEAKDPTGACVGAGLKVGQWVTTNSVSQFAFMGSEFATCSPEFISTIVKDVDEDPERLMQLWRDKRAAILEEQRRREEEARRAINENNSELR